jgi:hypothetical protein
MNPEYAELFSTPVRHRIIEKRTKRLEEYAKTINKEKLISVACNPSKSANPKRCFVNVEEQISRMGGYMLTGWIFNEYEHRHIDPEAHAIWVDRLGMKRVDITPHLHQPKRIIFLPDNRVAKKRGYTTVPGLILSNDPRIISLSRFTFLIHKLKEEKFTGFGEELAIYESEIETVRKDSGLPKDVADMILQTMMQRDHKMLKKYGEGS